MKSNPWFRLYSEFAFDPKVQSMPEHMQRRLIMLLCLRCSNDYVTLHETEVAFALRLGGDEWGETKALFMQKGFIDGGLNILNWDKRQYASDSSRERVRKHREALKGGSNVTVTPPDTDTDTDTERRLSKDNPTPPKGKGGAHKANKGIPDYTQDFEAFWKAYPKTLAPKKETFPVWERVMKRGVSPAIIMTGLAAYLSHIASTFHNPRHPTTWLNNDGWEVDYGGIESKHDASAGEDGVAAYMAELKAKQEQGIH